MAQQPFGEDAGRCRHVHLNEIGSSHALERIANVGMIAHGSRTRPPAEQVEIFGPDTIEQITVRRAPQKRTSKPMVSRTRTIWSLR